MNKFVPMVLLAGLLLAACNPAEEKPVTLSVDSRTLSVGEDGGTLQVGVTTSAVRWTATANAEWIALTPSGQRLEVAVEANPERQTRVATVWILADSRSEKVEVTQSAAGTLLDVDPSSLSLSCLGGTRILQVRTNVPDWTVSADADWLSVRGDPERGTVTLEVPVLRDTLARKATLTVRAGNDVRQFELTQAGEPLLALPYLKFGASPREVEQFEHARGSDLFDFYASTNQAKPVNKVVWYYDYHFGPCGLESVEGHANQQGLPDTLFFTQAFDAYMRDLGFRQTTHERDTYNFHYATYYSDSLHVQVALRDLNAVFPVSFEISPVNEEPYPTLDHIPWGFDCFEQEELDNIIRDWEAAHGGSICLTKTTEDYWGSRLFFDIQDSVFVDRMYHISHFPEPHLVLYSMHVKNEKINFIMFSPTGSNHFYPTKEFVSFLSKAGFEFMEIENRGYSFYSPTARLWLTAMHSWQGVELIVEKDK